MPLRIGWIDFNKEDRNRLEKALDEFRDSDTLDELGVGIIRDKFRERLLPGVVLPMTHLRYYFFSAYILSEIEKLKKIFKKDNYKETWQEAERRLRNSLKMKNGDEKTTGIIGIHNESRFAATFYWGHLHEYGLLKNIKRYALADYFNMLESKHKNTVNNDENGIENQQEKEIDFILEGLEKSKDEVMQVLRDKKSKTSLGFNLKSDERKYFKKALREDAYKDSLLCYGADKKKLGDELNEVLLRDASVNLHNCFENARVFSNLMGVAYNYYWRFVKKESSKKEYINKMKAYKKEFYAQVKDIHKLIDYLKQEFGIIEDGDESEVWFLRKIYSCIKTGKDTDIERELKKREEIAKTTRRLSGDSQEKPRDYKASRYAYQYNLDIANKFIIKMR